MIRRLIDGEGAHQPRIAAGLDHRRRIRPGQLALAVVCLLFGMALMVQIRTQNRLRETPPGQSSSDLAAIAADLYDSNLSLRQEVDKLLAQQATDGQSSASNDTADLQQEIDRLAAFNGIVAVTGPGIELTIDAAIRPVDVEDLLNVIRNAGAEAIAIGDQRVVFNTAIGGSPGLVTVNGIVVRRPVVFRAIGSADVLDRALDRKGGMLSYLRTAYPQAHITLVEREQISLPAYRGTLPVRPSAAS